MANVTPITPKGFAALLQIDFRKVYYEVGMERPREYTFWINVDQLGWNPVKDLQVAGLGPMGEKPVGTQFKLDNPVIGGQKVYEAVPYGQAVELTYEGWRDEQYGLFQTMTEEMSRSGRYREEVDAHQVLNEAFITTDPTAIGFTAGEALCGDHLGLDKVTRRNRPTVDIGFGVTFLQAAILHFHGLTNERGRPMMLTPRTCIITPTNVFVAREVLGSSGRPYTSDNELNALVEENLSFLVSHFLTSTTASFVLADKAQHDLNFLWRDAPSFDMFDDNMTRNCVETAYQRHTRGFGSWRGIYGSTG